MLRQVCGIMLSGDLKETYQTYPVTVWLLVLFFYISVGVDLVKTCVYPQGVDTDIWDPETYTPVQVQRLGLVQATCPAAAPSNTPNKSTSGAASKGVSKPLK